MPAQSLPGDISIEPVPPDNCAVYILRGHARHQGYGSPIAWTAIVTIAGDQARIIGLEVKSKGQTFTRRHAGAIKRWLINQGVTQANWERLDGGGLRAVTVTKTQNPLTKDRRHATKN